MEERGIKPRGVGDGGGGRRMDSRPPQTPPQEVMSKEEVDVIAKAIENATD